MDADVVAWADEGPALVAARYPDAMARLTRALELNPRLTNAAKLLGQIAFDEGDVDLAIRTYEKALKTAPNDADLANALAGLRKEADVHHTFSESRFDRFRVMFE